MRRNLSFKGIEIDVVSYVVRYIFLDLFIELNFREEV